MTELSTTLTREHLTIADLLVEKTKALLNSQTKEVISYTLDTSWTTAETLTLKVGEEKLTISLIRQK